MGDSTHLIVSFDAGSSSVKTLVYDQWARPVVATPGVEHELTTTADGGVEIPVEGLYRAALESLDQAHAALLERHLRPAAVALSTFWHSFLGVDAQGEPLTPILHLLDTRSQSVVGELKRDLVESELHARVGVVFHASYWPAKMVWLRRERPEWFAAARWMSFGEFLLERLFGRAVASTSMLSGTGLWNSNRQCYDEELLQYLGLRAEQLADLSVLDQLSVGLRPEFAQRWPLFAAIPWLPAIGDGAANNIGSGCDDPLEFALMVGTTGTMRAVFERESIVIPPGLWCYRVDRRRFVLGGALSNGGKVFEWVMDRFQMPEDWREQVAAIAPGSHGLTILPLFAGERSTKWRADARGAITGLSLDTTPVEILAAALESVALRFRQVYDILASEIGQPERVVATGEAMRRSPLWTQMMADALCRPVVACLEKETTSRGAAMLALERIGAIRSIRGIPTQLGQTYLPRPEYAGAYAEMLVQQKKLYRQLFETD